MFGGRLERYEVKLPNGRVIAQDLPAGLSDKEVRGMFASRMRKHGIDSSKQAVQRPKAELKEHKPTVAERLGDYIGAALSEIGMDQRHAYQWGNKLEGVLSNFTPVGNWDDFQRAESDFEKQLAILPLPGPAKDAIRKGIRAWHGSPHDFDRFDMSKIGTGEGAQAYGHGLYFAENKGVAEEYQRKLAPTRVEFGGKALDEPRKWWAAKDELEAKGDWRVAKALDELHSWGRQGYDTETALGYLRNEHRGSPQMLEAVDRMAQQVAMTKAPGRLYEVNINASPDEFLDWDAPLSAQPRAMDALRGIDLSAMPQGNRTRVLLERAGTRAEQPHYPATGRELLNAVSGYGDNRGRAEWDALMPHGLMGVRYLDQGSRGAAKGTRNYVVFDDGLIDIINKY